MLVIPAPTRSSIYCDNFYEMSADLLLSDEEDMTSTRDWRKALRAQPAYRIVNRTIRGQTVFTWIVGLSGLFFLIYMYTNSSKGTSGVLRSSGYNYTYPLTRPIKTSNVHTFRIGKGFNLSCSISLPILIVLRI